MHAARSRLAFMSTGSLIGTVGLVLPSPFSLTVKGEEMIQHKTQGENPQADEDKEDQCQEFPRPLSHVFLSSVR